MKALFILFIMVGPLFGSSTAHAKRFTNTYISFELPDQWKCELQGTEWVCGSEYRDKATQAIIILTAKESGPADTLPAYQTHLKTPKAVVLANGTSQQSQILQVKERRIANQTWVDGMHLGSEVANFYTRYLATVKDKLAILVTFSAHRKYYTQYSADFLRAIDSLKVVAPKNLLSKNPIGSGHGINHQQHWFPITPPHHMNPNIGELPPGAQQKKKSLKTLLGIALLLAALGFYFILKWRKS